MSIQQNPKYPSDEVMLQMIVSSLGPEELVRKACDWQRHQDAEICLGEKVDADATGEATDFSYNVACDHCAHSVRHSIRAEAKAKQPQCATCDDTGVLEFDDDTSSPCTRCPCLCKPSETTGWTDDEYRIPRCNVCGKLVRKILDARACHIVGGEG